jgi:hypothetical protein
MSQQRKIITDKWSYRQYVDQGLWKSKTTPKFYKAGQAIVEVDAKLKPRKGEEPRFVPATVIIQDFYSITDVAKPRQ